MTTYNLLGLGIIVLLSSLLVLNKFFVEEIKWLRKDDSISVNRMILIFAITLSLSVVLLNS